MLLFTQQRVLFVNYLNLKMHTSYDKLIPMLGGKIMKTLSEILKVVDDFVWGPAMLVLLVGTGIFLTLRTKFLCWRNLPYALKMVLSKEARIEPPPHI